MTHLRVLAPSETLSQLSQLRKLADSAMVVDHNEPFGDRRGLNFKPAMPG